MARVFGAVGVQQQQSTLPPGQLAEIKEIIRPRQERHTADKAYRTLFAEQQGDIKGTNVVLDKKFADLVLLYSKEIYKQVESTSQIDRHDTFGAQYAEKMNLLLNSPFARILKGLEQDSRGEELRLIEAHARRVAKFDSMNMLKEILQSQKQNTTLTRRELYAVFQGHVMLKQSVDDAIVRGFDGIFRVDISGSLYLNGIKELSCMQGLSSLPDETKEVFVARVMIWIRAQPSHGRAIFWAFAGRYTDQHRVSVFQASTLGVRSAQRMLESRGSQRRRT